MPSSSVLRVSFFKLSLRIRRSPPFPRTRPGPRDAMLTRPDPVRPQFEGPAVMASREITFATIFGTRPWASESLARVRPRVTSRGWATCVQLPPVEWPMQDNFERRLAGGTSRRHGHRIAVARVVRSRPEGTRAIDVSQDLFVQRAQCFLLQPKLPHRSSPPSAGSRATSGSLRLGSERCKRILPPRRRRRFIRLEVRLAARATVEA
jgi:hypothetical protein